MKVIYIMGAGHIGSTILDIVLGTHPDIESLGEVSKFHRFVRINDNNRKCACDSFVYECSFWLQVRQKWGDMVGGDDVTRYAYLQKQIEGSRSGWVRLLWNNYKQSTEFAEYLWKTEALYRAVQEVSGKQFLVDSSLSPRRAYAVAMNRNIDLYLIHFVRDGRGVIWSLMKPGKQIPSKVYIPAPPWRTTRYWISANLQSAWVFNRVSPEKRQMIRYEDFVTNPSLVLKKIGSLVGEDLSSLVTGLTVNYADQVRHLVGGNRVRMQKDIRIRPDFAWMEHLSEKDRRMFWRRAGWLAKRFGYMQHQTDYGI